jgi:hypothetical protein
MDTEGARKLVDGNPSPRSPGNGTIGSDESSENGQPSDPRQPQFVAADLLEAVEWILRRRRT